MISINKDIDKILKEEDFSFQPRNIDKRNRITVEQLRKKITKKIYEIVQRDHVLIGRLKDLVIPFNYMNKNEIYLSQVNGNYIAKYCHKIITIEEIADLFADKISKLSTRNLIKLSVLMLYENFDMDNSNPNELICKDLDRNAVNNAKIFDLKESFEFLPRNIGNRTITKEQCIKRIIGKLKEFGNLKETCYKICNYLSPGLIVLKNTKSKKGFKRNIFTYNKYYINNVEIHDHYLKQKTISLIKKADTKQLVNIANYINVGKFFVHKDGVSISLTENKSSKTERWLRCKNCNHPFTQTLHKDKRSLPICPKCKTHNIEKKEDTIKEEFDFVPRNIDKREKEREEQESKRLIQLFNQENVESHNPIIVRKTNLINLGCFKSFTGTLNLVGSQIHSFPETAISFNGNLIISKLNDFNFNNLRFFDGLINATNCTGTISFGNNFTLNGDLILIGNSFNLKIGKNFKIQNGHIHTIEETINLIPEELRRYIVI